MGLRGGEMRTAHPLYTDLSVEYSREREEMAFGETLSGKLKFIDTDFDWIMAQDRGADILVHVARGDMVFLGKFVITDCELDYDGRKIEVELEADDAYSWLKAHWDDEYNLVGLAPKRDIVEYRRRGCWQYYRQGDKKLTAIVGGDYFEMDATQTASYADLTDKYFFNLIDAEASIKVVMPTDINAWKVSHMDIIEANGKVFKGLASGYLTCADLDGFRLKVTLGSLAGDKKSGIQNVALEYKNASGAWIVANLGTRVPAYDPQLGITYSYGISGGHADTVFYYGGEEELYFTGMFARVVHNSETFTPKYNLPDDDIVARTLNYRYVSIPSASMVHLYANDEYSGEPTEWGLAPDNVNYYTKPVFSAVTGITYPLYPVGKTTWGEYSWWTGFDFNSGIFDYVWWDTVALKDAYPLDSVLSVLLGAVFKESGLSVTFAADEAHSVFLYGAQGAVENPPHLYITPKSNVLTSNYSQAAQKGNITIGQVLEMLRDTLRCMWHLERDASTGAYALRLEHVYWYMNGASYTGGTGYDIRNAKDARTGKNWDYGTHRYSFDVAELYRRYEFGWQDECTDWFEGDSLNCLAKYVNAENVNKVQVKMFATDLDMMLLSPEEFSKDGFALLGASQEYLMSYLYNPSMTLSGGVESSRFVLAREADADTFVELRRKPALVMYLTCYNSSGTRLSSSLPERVDGRWRYTMPKGTSYISYRLDSPSGFTADVNVVPVSFNDRVEIPDSSEDVAPQNYRLAFHYIERSWYLHDLPCRSIAYGDGANREEYMVNPYNGVKKAMTQKVKMPWASGMNPYAGILSTFGAAMIRSFTLNLLSLFVEMELGYGTDTK